jgi:predicted metalloenzyme YecM
MPELNSLIGDYESFLSDILSRVEDSGFNLSDFVQIDHMCYRTTSQENYKIKKNELGQVAKLVGETTVNGRLISTFRLTTPVYFDKWRIDAVELPAPKEGSQHIEGLEHIEFILFDDIPIFLKKYEGKPFDMRAANRGLNPEIGLKLDNYSVKFHLVALPTVVFLENKLGIDDVRDK